MIKGLLKGLLAFPFLLSQLTLHQTIHTVDAVFTTLTILPEGDKTVKQRSSVKKIAETFRYKKYTLFSAL
ncbi:MAG: hypothetical protein RQM95_04160 [Syntrophaceticus schinkii]